MPRAVVADQRIARRDCGRRPAGRWRLVRARRDRAETSYRVGDTREKLVIAVMFLALALAGCGRPVPGDPLVPSPVTTPAGPAPVTTPSEPVPVTTPVSPAPVTTPVSPAPVTTPVSPAPVTTPVKPAPVTTPAAERFRVIGQATAGGAAPIAGVKVVFKLTTADPNCQTCQAYSAVTGADGRYSLEIPGGQYVGGCALPGYTCAFEIAPTDRFITLSLTSGWTGDLLITGDQVMPSTPMTGPAPDSNQPDLRGYVYDRSGHPVPNVPIEIKLNDLNQHTFTNSAGYYEIDQIQMTGTLFCAAIGSCTAVNVTQPITVSAGDPPRVVNWIDG